LSPTGGIADLASKEAANPAEGSSDVSRRWRLPPTALAGLAVAAVLVPGPSGPTASAASPVFGGPVPRAQCGPGSLPEPGIQGRVSRADRDSGRSRKGYRCNLELVGQYQGQGTTWVSQSFKTCAYHAQAFPASVFGKAPGVHVVDVRDPAHPRLARRLTSPAFLGNTWESLKVNPRRQLLAGVQVGSLDGAAFFDVYDVRNCAAPRLLNKAGAGQLSLPANALGHEGNWSPDGRTYWATGLKPGTITAIDVSDPTMPKLAFTGASGITNHGLSVSPDGKRLYLASLSPAGLQIFDVSEVQARKPLPHIYQVGNVFWQDGSGGQHALHITYAGKPYVVFVDEAGLGAARIIDISDETAPRIVSKLKLEIQMKNRAAARSADLKGNTSFGYEAHYCEVDRPVDPTALACGYFQSGVRVFDIRNPLQPREIAYFNPPAQVGKANRLPGSNHAHEDPRLRTDWCSSPPRFVAPNQLWVTCQDNGFMVLRFTNAAYPILTGPDRGRRPPS
jgi:hypothetical protein